MLELLEHFPLALTVGVAGLVLAIRRDVRTVRKESRDSEVSLAKWRQHIDDRLKHVDERHDNTVDDLKDLREWKVLHSDKCTKEHQEIIRAIERMDAHIGHLLKEKG